MTDRGGWRRSSHCSSGTCVEVKLLEDGVLVRDSKRPSSPTLQFTPAEWAAFLAGVRSGEFDGENERRRPIP